MTVVRRRQLIAAAIAAALVLGMSAAWRWTPLSEQIDASHLAHWAAAIRHSPFGPLMLALVYVAAGVVMLPNMVLNAAVILSLGNKLGLACALGGSMISALVFYALGRRYGTRSLRKLAPQQLERLQQMMEHGGTLKMASLRLLPIAPFSVVNVVAGSIGLRVLPFAAGTFLGLLPGGLMMTAFGHQLRAVVRDPAPHDFVLLAIIVLVAGACAWWLRRRSRGAAVSSDSAAAASLEDGPSRTY